MPPVVCYHLFLTTFTLFLFLPPSPHLHFLCSPELLGADEIRCCCPSFVLGERERKRLVLFIYTVGGLNEMDACRGLCPPVYMARQGSIHMDGNGVWFGWWGLVILLFIPLCWFSNLTDNEWAGRTEGRVCLGGVFLSLLYNLS